MRPPCVHRNLKSDSPRDERGDLPARSPRAAPHFIMTGPKRRQMTVALALLAGVLVADPSFQSPVAEASAVSAAPAVASEVAYTERVSELLAEWNGRLDPAERDRIARAVMRWSRDYALDPDLVLGVIYVESTARPDARSPKGAMGLMQIMPHMRRQIGLAGNATTIESNIEAGCAILSENIGRLGEDDGILAYFWGSKIRGDRYLRRVRHAQAEARRFLSQS